MVCESVRSPPPILVKPPEPANTPDCDAAPELLIVSRPPPVLIAGRLMVTALSDIPAPPDANAPAPVMLPVPLGPLGSFAVSVITPLLVVIPAVKMMLLRACAVSPIPAPAMLTAVLKSILLVACNTTLLPAPLISATSILESPADTPAVANRSTPLTPVRVEASAGKPANTTLMFVGSSSQVPVNPLEAVVLTRAPVTLKFPFPEVSTNPPSPPCDPPLAEMLP